MKNPRDESAGEIGDETLTPGAVDVQLWRVSVWGDISHPSPPAVWSLGSEGLCRGPFLAGLRDPGTRLPMAPPCVPPDWPSQDPVQLEASSWVSPAVGLSCGRLCSQPRGRAGAGGSASESEILWGSFSRTLTSLWPQHWARRRRAWAVASDCPMSK